MKRVKNLPQLRQVQLATVCSDSGQLSLDVLHSVSCAGFACSRVPEGPRARVLGGCGGFSPPARGGAGEEKPLYGVSSEASVRGT